MKIMHSKIMDLSQNYVNPFSVGHNSSRWHFYVLFFKKKEKSKAWQFMWVVCQADIIYKMSDLIFSEK